MPTPRDVYNYWATQLPTLRQQRIAADQQPPAEGLAGLLSTVGRGISAGMAAKQEQLSAIRAAQERVTAEQLKYERSLELMREQQGLITERVTEEARIRGQYPSQTRPLVSETSEAVFDPVTGKWETRRFQPFPRTTITRRIGEPPTRAMTPGDISRLNESIISGVYGPMTQAVTRKEAQPTRRGLGGLVDVARGLAGALPAAPTIRETRKLSLYNVDPAGATVASRGAAILAQVSKGLPVENARKLMAQIKTKAVKDAATQKQPSNAVELAEQYDIAIDRVAIGETPTRLEEAETVDVGAWSPEAQRWFEGLSPEEKRAALEE